MYRYHYKIAYVFQSSIKYIKTKDMRLKKGHYIIIPSAVFFSDLTPREKLALLTIFSFTSQREDYTTTLANSALEKATSMDERTVKKALLELQEKGLIKLNYPTSKVRTITLNADSLINYFNIEIEENEKKIQKTLDKTTQKPYNYMSAEEKKKKEEKEREERRAYSIRLAEERNKNLKNYPYRKREN